MKFAFGRILTRGACMLLGMLPLGAQTATPQKPLMAEDVFKNVQVLKGIPVKPVRPGNPRLDAAESRRPFCAATHAKRGLGCACWC